MSNVVKNISCEIEKLTRNLNYPRIVLPIKCTGPDPAISTAPSLFKNPCSPQTHPAGIQYTMVFSKLKRQYALKLHLQKVNNLDNRQL